MGKKVCIDYLYVQEETSSHSRVLAGSCVSGDYAQENLILFGKPSFNFLVNLN